MPAEFTAVRAAHEIGEGGAVLFQIRDQRLEATHSDAPLVFFHVPKTAGTTLSINFQNLYREKYWSARSELVVRQQMDRLARYSMIGGHFSPGFIFENFDTNQLLTMIRDPIQRSLSQYCNWSDKDRIEWDSDAWNIDEEARAAFEFAENHSAFEFLSQKKNRLILDNTRNIFVRSYVGRPDVDALDDNPALVEEAFENLRGYFWIGIVEQMQASLLTLARQLNAPSLVGVGRERHNVSAAPAHLSAGELNAVREFNKLDYALMDLVTQEFARRYDIIAQDAIWRTAEQSYIRTGLWKIEKYLPIDFDNIVFVRGWSFPEIDGLDRPYRWSHWNEEAVIYLKDLPVFRNNRIIICFNILAFDENMSVEDLSVSWGDCSPRSTELRETNQAWQLRAVFDVGRSFGKRLSITHNTTAQTKRTEDDRELGFALSSVGWEVLSPFAGDVTSVQSDDLVGRS